MLVGWTVVLPFLLPGQTAGISLPVYQGKGFSALLRVQVPENPAAPGLGQCLMSLEVTGPSTLEVDGLRFEDALASWQCPNQSSSWAQDNSGTRITLGWRLVQTKPGAAPLPGVAVRIRGDGNWEEVTWPEILHEIREPPGIITSGTQTESAQAAFVQLLGMGLAFALSLLAVYLAWRRFRPKTLPVTPKAQALAELDTIAQSEAGYEALDLLLRRYLEAQLAIPATRMTSAELLAGTNKARELQAVLQIPSISVALKELLAKCDLAKFAGYSGDGADWRQVLATARAVIGEIESKASECEPFRKSGDSAQDG